MTPAEIDALPYRLNVGIMLANAQGHVFVGQRLDSTADAWQMPQGGIDDGEDPQSAALRELEEETGVAPTHVRIEAEAPDWVTYDLPHDLVPQIWNGKFRGQKQRWFLMRFVGPESAINITTGHPEFSRWQWLPPEKLVGAIVPFKRDVYRAVLSYFEDKL